MLNYKSYLNFVFLLLITIVTLSITGCNKTSSVNGEGVTASNKSIPHVIEQSAVLEILNKNDRSYQIIDVRTPQEYANGHLKTAINIPHEMIVNEPTILENYKDKNLVFYCRSGRRAGLAMSAFDFSNYKGVYHLDGDMAAWNAADLPTFK